MFGQGIVTEALTELIRGLKADGVWDKTEFICVARGSETASLTNLKNAAEICSNVGSAAFSPHRGFTLNSTSAYINTNKIPTITSSSGHLWSYLRSNTTPASSARSFMGCNTSGAVSVHDTLSFTTFTSPDETSSGIFGSSGGAGSVSIASNLPVGFIGASRTGTAAIEMRIQGTTATTAVAPSPTPTATMAHTMFVGAINNSGSVLGGVPGEYAGWGFGSGLTTTELGNLRTRIQAYMTAIGA